jgi:hypothetical protein
MLAFYLGLMIGACLGIVFLSLLTMASQGERQQKTLAQARANFPKEPPHAPL